MYFLRVADVQVVKSIEEVVSVPFELFFLLSRGNLVEGDASLNQLIPLEFGSIIRTAPVSSKFSRRKELRTIRSGAPIDMDFLPKILRHDSQIEDKEEKIKRKRASESLREREGMNSSINNEG